MAEILIKNMEIPQKGNVGISIYADGSVEICGTGSLSKPIYGTPTTKAIEVSTHLDWHTGRPTEEGWYFCLVDTGTETKFMANEWKDIAGYQWVYGFLGEIIAWRKAEDPIKILNEAKSDFVK